MALEMIQWQGVPVHVRAHYIPKYLWFTVSIDVALGGRTILRTGGQLRMVGVAVSQFEHDGIQHEAQLEWQQSKQDQFPFTLKIDGTDVLSAQVGMDNAWTAVVRRVVLLTL